jgi:hypothetical protein
MNSLVSIMGNGKNIIPKVIIIEPNTYLPITDNLFTGNTLTVSSFSGNNSYQNGTYYAGSSGTYNSNYSPYVVFNNIGNNIRTWGWVSPNYTYVSNTGIYSGSVSTSVNGTNILGEWVQIYLPFNFILTNYQLKNSGGDAGGGMPTIGYLLGSNDGSNWTQIDKLNHTSSYWRSNRDLKDYSVSITTSYSIYRLVFNQVGESNNAFASMMNFNLFGLIE